MDTQQTKEITPTNEEALNKILEVEKKEMTADPVNLMQPRISVEMLNRKTRRQMKLPFVMWGCYNELGFLMTVGTHSKASHWANNHRVMRNPDLPTDRPLTKEEKRKMWLPRTLSLRPIFLMGKNAFQSPIKLTDPILDLKTIKK